MMRSRCALLSGFAVLSLLGCGAQVAQIDHDAAPVVPPLAAAQQSAQPPADPTAGQKIIYQATLAFHVADFAVADARIRKLVQSTGGFLAQYREDRPSGAQRGGHWTLRIPVPQFERFVEEAGALGVCERREITSTSVTEEFVDLEARLRNKQQLETRLLELVAKRTDEVKDVLTVENEIGRVREEVERLQGRLRMLTDRVALTTVEISAYERHDYRPPEATFAGRIRDTWQHSLDQMRQLGEACVLAAVALAPWLALGVVPLLPLIWFVRRCVRKTQSRVVNAQIA